MKLFLKSLLVRKPSVEKLSADAIITPGVDVTGMNEAEVRALESQELSEKERVFFARLRIAGLKLAERPDYTGLCEDLEKRDVA